MFGNVCQTEKVDSENRKYSLAKVYETCYFSYTIHLDSCSVIVSPRNNTY